MFNKSLDREYKAYLVECQTKREMPLPFNEWLEVFHYDQLEFCD